MRRIRRSLITCFKNPLFLVRIRGESGWPLLVPGKRHFASSFFRPTPGDFIVFKNPRNKTDIFIKRVVFIREGGYEVESMVPWGSSSADLGIIQEEDVLGTLFLSRK